MTVRQKAASRIVVAVPVAARETVRRMKQIADEVVCVATPEPFQAVGLWYDDFAQMADAEVIEVLRKP